MRPWRRGALHVAVVFCSGASWPRARARRWIRVLGSVSDAGFGAFDTVGGGGDGVVGGDVFGGAGVVVRVSLLALVSGGGRRCVVGTWGGHAVHIVQEDEFARIS